MSTNTTYAERRGSLFDADPADLLEHFDTEWFRGWRYRHLGDERRGDGKAVTGSVGGDGLAGLVEQFVDGAVAGLVFQQHVDGQGRRAVDEVLQQNESLPGA